MLAEILLNRIKNELLNFGLKFMNVDEKIVRMFLETSPSKVEEIVILPAIKIVMKKLINKLQNKRVHGRVYNGSLNGVRVSIIRSLVGCPNAAIAVECLKRCKTKTILRVDFCGGIKTGDNPIKIGDNLIPRIAYCGDGTSPQYIINHSILANQLSFIANPITKVQEIKSGNQNVFITHPDQKLKDILLNEGMSLFPNRVKEVDFWTIDALFCETYDFMQAMMSKNIGGLDMESSVLFLLGKLYGLKTVSILSVSDLPGNPKYDLFKSNEIHPDLERGINNAIKILMNSLQKVRNLT